MRFWTSKFVVLGTLRFNLISESSLVQDIIGLTELIALKRPIINLFLIAQMVGGSIKLIQQIRPLDQLVKV